MAGLFNSFAKGSRWLGRNVLPVLASGYGAGYGVAASAIAKSTESSSTPAGPQPVLMPDQEEVNKNARRAAALQLQNSGRQSTVLSQGGDGGGDKLGG